MHRNQSTNKMKENDGKIQLTIFIKSYKRFFNVNTGNAINIFDAGVEDDMGVPEKHIIDFFGLMYTLLNI